MPRFLVALLAAVGVSALTFAVAMVVWDGGQVDGSVFLYVVPGFALLSAALLAFAGALTRGRLVPLLLVAAVASVVGGLGIGWMTAGITTHYSLWDAALFATTLLAAGFVPGAAVFSRVFLAAPRAGAASA